MYIINQITGRASEPALETQLTARGVESPRSVGTGAGYAAGTATSRSISRTCCLKAALYQNVTFMVTLEFS